MLDNRLALSFDVLGLPLREAILLKSFMRLLDNRLHHRWVYSANPESQAPVLTFLIDGEDRSSKIRMGVMEISVVASLSRPLRTEELEHELNRLGGLVQRSRTGVATVVAQELGFAPKPPLASAVPVLPESSAPALAAQPDDCAAAPSVLPTLASAAAKDSVTPTKATLPAQPEAAPLPPPQPLPANPNELLRLLRWPHASLLRTPAQSKLAAFMLGAPISVQTLQLRSGQPLPACLEFVSELRRMGFVISVPAGQLVDPVFGALPQARAKLSFALPANKPSRPPVGLFSRIRQRLGISQARSH